jgi:hypothetical protein
VSYNGTLLVFTSRSLTKSAPNPSTWRAAKHRRIEIVYEEEITYPTSDSTVLDLLIHHEWRKLMRRSFYPQRKCQTSMVHAVESILERLAALRDQVFICGF